MSDLLNITTPVAPKNYDFSPKNNPQQTQTDRVFNLGFFMTTIAPRTACSTIWHRQSTPTFND